MFEDSSERIQTRTAEIQKLEKEQAKEQKEWERICESLQGKQFLVYSC